MREAAEKEAIIRIKNGEVDHFNFFVKRYSKMLFHFVKMKVGDPHDAEDIVQNSFIKAYRSISKIDHNKPFYPYLFTITKNEIYDYFRKKKYQVKLLEETVSYEDKYGTDKEEFGSALGKLKKEHSMVLKLYYLEGFNYKEISQKIKKPLNTVRTLLRRAKIAIKRNYEK